MTGFAMMGSDDGEVGNAGGGRKNERWGCQTSSPVLRASGSKKFLHEKVASKRTSWLSPLFNLDTEGIPHYWLGSTLSPP